MDKAHHRPQQQPSNQQHPLQVQPQAQQVYYDHQYQHDDHQYQHDDHQYQHDGQQQRLHDRIYQEYLYQQHLQRQQQLENLLKGPASFISYGRLYELFQCVGPSSEGSVSLARTFVRTSPTTELRVVKMVKSGGPDVSGPPREALMLNTAGPHPNVIKMFEVAYDQRWGKALLCIEYCSGGNLYEMQQDYCNREVPVPKQVVFQAIINISDALAFIHGGWVRDNATGNYRKTIDLLEQRRIVHRDLVRFRRDDDLVSSVS
jgi:serine/threonine protein kinase